jgi:predicted transcriptional regulator
MAVTTVRLGDETLRELDALAEREGVDRTTVLKKALDLGVREMKIDRAVDRYQKGFISAWRAAQEAGISLWEFIDVLKKREIGFVTSEEDLERMLEDFK